ncbi:MAG: hypothetical protein V1797_00160 [Pseudomonadota bacterium]
MPRPSRCLRPALHLILTCLVCGSLALAAPAPAGAASADPLVVLQKRVQTILGEMDQAVAVAAHRLAEDGLEGPLSSRTLAFLCAGQHLAIDCAAISPKGVMVVVEPAAYKRFEGSNIAGQAQVAQVIATAKPVLSAYFHTVEGVGAVDLERPVLGADGQYLGSASLIFDPTRLMERALQGLSLPAGAKAFLVQGDGRMLFNSESAEIGRSLVADQLYAQNQAVKDLTWKILAEESGSFGPYEFKGHGDLPTRRMSRWTSVGLHGVRWRVGISQPAN